MIAVIKNWEHKVKRTLSLSFTQKKYFLISTTVWIATIVLLPILTSTYPSRPDVPLVLHAFAIVDVLIGIAAFLVMSVLGTVMWVRYARREILPFIRSGKYYFLFLLLIGAFLLGALSINNTAFSRMLGLTTQATPTPSLAVAPSPTNTPMPTPTLDSNPIITCNIHESCGGGSKLLRHNVCSNSTCCGFSDGRWIFYESKAKCKQDQDAQNNQQPQQQNQNQSPQGSRNKVQVVVDDMGGITKGTFYCYEDRANVIANLQNDIRIKQTVADVCNSNENSKVQSCANNCPTSSDITVSEISACIDNCSSSIRGNCADKNNAVGDLRWQLHAEVLKSCP